MVGILAKVLIWRCCTVALALDALSVTIDEVAMTDTGSMVLTSSVHGTNAVVGLDSGALQVLDVASMAPVGASVDAHEKTVMAVSHNQAGTYLASGAIDGTLQLRDAATMVVISTQHLSGAGSGQGSLGEDTEGLWSVAFSPDGSRIASGSGSGELTLWSTPSLDRIRSVHAHNASVTVVIFSPDSAHVYSCSWDSTVQRRDATTLQSNKVLTKAHTDRIASMQLSPDGARLVTGGWDKRICIWDAQTLSLVATRPDIDTGLFGIISLAFTPEGTRLISGAASSGKVQMWEATTLTLLGEVNASSTWVTTVRVTQLPQEGMALRLITASVDKTVRAWNIVEDAESPGSGTFVRVAMDSSSTGGA